MYEALRIFWNLAAVGGAIAVGLTTHDAGLTALTFFGGLIVPRIMGLLPRRHWGFAGRGGCRGDWQRARAERFAALHREAHGDTPPQRA